jgi:hypothetical protein
MAPSPNSSAAAASVSPVIPPAATSKTATVESSQSAESGNGRGPTPVAASDSVSAPTPTIAPAVASNAEPRDAAVPTNGIGSAQIEAIKAALQGQKFLWSMLDAVTRWEVENGELRLFFPSESRSLSEMLQARDPMERLRTVLNQVVGQPLRVCVKLDSSRAAAPAGRSSELRARFEEDPIVRAMLEKFGGQISNVKRPGEE